MYPFVKSSWSWTLSSFNSSWFIRYRVLVGGATSDITLIALLICLLEGNSSNNSSSITSGNSSYIRLTHLGKLTKLVASFGSNSFSTRITHNMSQPPLYSFSKVFSNTKWMVYPPIVGISCAFIRTIPFLDGIITSLLCHSMSTLLWVMNSIPKMHSIPPKVETNKSTFPLQFPSWRGKSLTCNVVGWGTPSEKGTSMGALSSSK